MFFFFDKVGKDILVWGDIRSLFLTYHAPVWKIKSIFFLSLLNHQDRENGGRDSLSFTPPLA